MKQSLKTKLKQLWFPAAFRLPEPEFTKDQLDLLEELLQLIHPTLSAAEMATRDEKLQMAHFLVDLGTGIWRIRRKIEGLTRMPKEIRDTLYALESTWMSMSEGGVEIVDHIGTIPSKNEAKVVEVREIPNLAREQVVDAIKPTILLRGEVVQLGEVIMGRPAASPDHEAQHIPEAAPMEAPAPVAPDEEDEPVITHEVETLVMELPLKPQTDAPAAEDDMPTLLPETPEVPEAEPQVAETEPAQSEMPEAPEAELPPEIEPEQPEISGAPEAELPQAIEPEQPIVDVTEPASETPLVDAPPADDAGVEKPKRKRAPRKPKATEAENAEPKPKRAKRPPKTEAEPEVEADG